jgi:hypothetical protein
MIPRSSLRGATVNRLQLDLHGSQSVAPKTDRARRGAPLTRDGELEEATEIVTQLTPAPRHSCCNGAGHVDVELRVSVKYGTEDRVARRKNMVCGRTAIKLYSRPSLGARSRSTGRCPRTRARDDVWTRGGGVTR